MGKQVNFQIFYNTLFHNLLPIELVTTHSFGHNYLCGTCESPPAIRGRHFSALWLSNTWPYIWDSKRRTEKETDSLLGGHSITLVVEGGEGSVESLWGSCHKG